MHPSRAVFAAIAAICLLSSPVAGAMSGLPPVVASGKVVSETRAVSGFTGVRLGLPGTVVLKQGSPASVLIEADDNLLPEISTVVVGGSLEIRFKSRMNVTGRPTIRLLVTSPSFDSLAIEGSGDIVAESIEARELSVSVAGSGDVKIARLTAGVLNASIAGSGELRVAGRADDVAVKIAGSGDVVAGPLEAKRAKVTISGSGDVAMMVREKLDVSIAGSGDVRYHGDPEVTRRIAGSGSVKRLGP